MNQDLDDPAAAGGEKEGLFAPTRWTVVLGAKGDSLEALNSLCNVYRPALIAWLCSRGEKREQAEDSVQGFFAHLLQHSGFKNVGRDKGRFRTFLLTAFQNFLRDEHRRSNAAKRGGDQKLASLDETNEEGGPAVNPVAMGAAPDLAYDRAWAQAVLSGALKQLEAECSGSGHRTLCVALEPVLFQDEDAPAYGQIALELQMTETAVKTAAHRIRRRLKALVRQQVLETVVNEADVEAELRHLKGLFGPTGDIG